MQMGNEVAVTPNAISLFLNGAKNLVDDVIFQVAG
jgi:hypothetical protein